MDKGIVNITLEESKDTLGCKVHLDGAFSLRAIGGAIVSLRKDFAKATDRSEEEKRRSESWRKHTRRPKILPKKQSART